MTPTPRPDDWRGWQARQPVQTRSVERWRHYYDQAPDFFDRLAAIDAQYDPVR
jgi:hypothetical protein